ncbi:MAG TPA: hypothetical protein VFW17_17415 [Ktedonobacterales bacterium]|jgi:NTP pyrophosphatase (non-canonical NTP hydrolase)|nr:hypothetical protein [Ktedonobacterales bacterium]
MITEHLKALMERIEQLPPDMQNKLAEEIEDILDDAEWHALLADPRSGSVLDDLIAQAKRSPKRPWPTPHDMGDDE